MERTGKEHAAMVAGHICLDITPAFHMPAAKNLGEVLAPGKLVHVGGANIHTGGVVSNTGLAMKVLGANVRLAGKVGCDAFGRVVRDKLDEYGCGGDLTADSSVTTSYSVVVAVPGVDRVFLHHPGANDSFGAGDVTDEMLAGVRHFHFGYPPLMRRMYEDGGAELTALLRRVKAKGITTSLDMAAVDPASPAGLADWGAILQNALPYVDFFVPSVEELCFMLDRPRYEAWNRRAAGGDVTGVLDVEKDVEPLANRLMAMGAKVVLIKCGAPGMLYRTAGQPALEGILQAHGLAPAEWCGKAGFEKSYLVTDIVSGTGAGDTSIAAFLTSMLSGHGLERCVKLAAATGACCLSSYDALGGLRPLDELWERICQGWEKRV